MFYCVIALHPPEKGEHIIQAVDTRTDSKADRYKHLVCPEQWEELLRARKRKHRIHHAHLTNGAIGCYLSHLITWQKLLTSKHELCLVLEEDAMCVRTTRFFPPREEWDILLLGCIDLKPYSNKVWRKVDHFLETHAYIIKKETVRKVLHKMLPIKMQIDWKLSQLAKNKEIKIMGCFPPIFRQDKRRGTNIQNLPVPPRPVLPRPVHNFLGFLKE